MSNSKFTFIDHKAIDEPESRRVIRSQVMKGRNLGRVLPPRRRPRSKQTDPYEANIRIIEYDPSLLQKMTPGLPAQVGNEFSGFSKIPHMTPRDWKLAYTSLHRHINMVYPPGICEIRPKNFSWFAKFMTDKACKANVSSSKNQDGMAKSFSDFHTWMALAHLTVGSASENKNLTVRNEYTRHLVQALHLTNKKISENRHIADITIACVVTLCCLSFRSEQPWQTKMHFEGLVRMINLRGGLPKLWPYSVFCRSAQHFDISLSFQLGCSPCLSEELKPLEAVVGCPIDISLLSHSPLLAMLRDSADEVKKGALEVLKLTHVFNTCEKETRLKPGEFEDMMVQVRYRLLHICSGGEFFYNDPVAEAICLGLLTYAMTLDFLYASSEPYKGFFNKLKNALDNPSFLAVVDPGTYLWLLMVTGISVVGTQGRGWLASRIQAVSATYARSDWAFAREVLEAYPWTPRWHDQVGSGFWNQCLQGGTLEPENDQGLEQFIS